MKNKKLLILACTIFGVLYLLVSIISLVCSTEFFKLAHGGIMSWMLAIGFELGAMACLVSTLILPKHKLGLVWIMFVILTLFQMMGNSYMAYASLENYDGWIEMFGLNESEPIFQKRVLALISGAILPLVALGFIRIMVTAVTGEENKEETSEPELTPKHELTPKPTPKHELTPKTEPIPESKPEPEPEPIPESKTKKKAETKKPKTNTQLSEKQEAAGWSNITPMEQQHTINPSLRKPSEFDI